MENTKKYKIKVTEGLGWNYTDKDYDSVKEYELEIETDRIDWSLEQYARHRTIKSYKILEIDGVEQTDDSSSL